MTCVEAVTRGEIVELRLARAPVNALDPALCNGLGGALATALGAGARGIILSGGPKVFSAGLDVPFLLSLGDDRVALKAAWEAFFDAARAIAESPVPVVAAIAGHAPAGGCVLALCCDYRVMAAGPEPDRPFRIGLNETQVGLVAPEGIQRLLRRVVGVHRAERMLIAGEMVEADRALRYGLVDELVDVDAVGARSLAWLQGLLAMPREAMLETRRIARADVAQALQADNIELDRFIDAWFSPPTQAALRALVAKLGK